MTEHNTDKPLVLAITACPTGIAHTYMAAEKLYEAAADAGVRVAVETHGSIGVEGRFTEDDIKRADAVLVAADVAIDTARFGGKRLLRVGVDKAIAQPTQLLRDTLDAPVQKAASTQAEQPVQEVSLYKALMNGVSHMVPFVVTGGLLLAVSLSLGGEPSAEGLVIPEGSFWYTISELGVLAFSLMVPVLSAYIAVGVADRAALAPGFVTGLVATTGSLYGSEAGAGFIGGIISGLLSGYVALGLKKIPVNKFVAPIWPIIVIPIVTTLVVSLAFIYLLGAPISALFEALTNYLAGMQGTSVILLGAIIGAMIAFDMGGPFNKTAFLFGGGLIAAGNPAPMGMAAAAIAVPPLAVGVATLIRRAWFTKAERDSGIAALFMGFFGITEGAIPLAAARPVHVIPANVVGGAVAGCVAGLLGVADNVMHGGPIVAVLGAVDNVLGFFIALAAGVFVNAGILLALVGWSNRGTHVEEDKDDKEGILPVGAVSLDRHFERRDDAIRALAHSLESEGRVTDAEALVKAAIERETQHSTSVGNGVAIPHARSAAVTRSSLAFARLQEPGVEWAAGEEGSRLVFLIAVPDNAGKEHMRVLSTLARALMKEDFRQQLLSASSERDVVQIVEDRVGAELEPKPAV